MSLLWTTGQIVGGTSQSTASEPPTSPQGGRPGQPKQNGHKSSKEVTNNKGKYPVNYEIEIRL